jgi:hypothetical protein
MKYVLLFGSSADDARATMAPERYDAISVEIMEWWGKHAAAGTIVGGERLQAGATATTVRGANGTQSVTDGPFIEAKEEISGYGLIEVDDLDAALALARTWPALQIPGDSVEVRPVIAM